MSNPKATEDHVQFVHTMRLFVRLKWIKIEHFHTFSGVTLTIFMFHHNQLPPHIWDEYFLNSLIRQHNLILVSLLPSTQTFITYTHTQLDWNDLIPLASYTPIRAMPELFNIGFHRHSESVRH